LMKKGESGATGVGAGVVRLRALVRCGVAAAESRIYLEAKREVTVNRETEVEIIRLFHAEKWCPTAIATQLQLHHSTVRRVLVSDGVPARHFQTRKTKADLYIPFILATLEKYPKLTAARLYAMVKERGYDGAPSRFRAVVASLRPRPAPEAYLRTSTLPGEQGQCDWAHFGRVKFGNAERRLLAFVIVLSWSRHIFVRFYTGDAMPNFLRGHVDAFNYFDAVPREILYDNLKSAVLERYGSAIRFNPQLLDLAAHYRFLPKPTGVRKPQQKGRVERAIQYIRHSFFAARQWADLEDLNNQARDWCLEVAGLRNSSEQAGLTVMQAFEKEKSSLVVLPSNPYPCFERKDVRVGKTPYVRFDLNDYSVPHKYVQRSLTVRAAPDAVRIFHENEEIAHHMRCYDRGQQIEDKAHVKALESYKEAAAKHRSIDVLRHAAPQAAELIKLAAERGHNLGRLTQRLTELLGLYGPEELEVAIKEALACDSPHAAAVLQCLESRRNKRGLLPPVVLNFGTSSPAKDLIVVPKTLDSYDNLSQMQEGVGDA
jgi:transposase